MKIFRKSRFHGVFPHKGKLCAKVSNSFGTVRWIPVSGRVDGKDFILADAVRTSELHLDPGLLHPEDVAGLTPCRGHVFLSGSRWVRLEKDWTFSVHAGPDHWQETIRSPCELMIADSGDPHFSAVVWVKR